MTLIEMLVVMSIIALLMAFLVVGVAGLRKRAKERATQQTIRLLSVAIERFKEEWDTYPPDRIEAVLALIEGGPVDIDLVTAGVQLPEGYYSDDIADDNEGIKALYIALTCPKKGGPFIGSGEIKTREIGTQHIYYARRPTICAGTDLDCDTAVAAGTDDIQVQAVGAGGLNRETVVVEAGPNGRLDTVADANDEVVFDDPEPIMTFLDAWGKDFRYDRGDTAGDNAQVLTPNPSTALPDVHNGSGDAHLLRNQASFDLWSMGANGTDECVDAFSAIVEPIAGGDTTCNTSASGDDDQVVNSGTSATPGQVVVTYGADEILDTAAGGDDRLSAINREIWDGDDGDDIRNWELDIYENR